MESGPNRTVHSRLKWNLPSAARSDLRPFHALPTSEIRCSAEIDERDDRAEAVQHARGCPARR